MVSSSAAVRELPLFPLPEVVLFPGRPLPLHIFEFRYRIMINTILEADSQFGVLMIDPLDGEIAKVGCCAEVISHQRLPDDRLKLLSLGKRRFRLLDYVREKPYRVGLVEWLYDRVSPVQLEPQGDKVAQLLKDVVHLSAKLTDQKIELPEDLPESPIDLSYWIASNLYGVASEQQQLLEMQDTAERLEREIEILGATRNQLAARTALKDALN
ncbi:MAG: LON peptidase substrate-binding domain-containing protein [Cyanobacteria bacterium P01_H01_bin.15]